MRVIAGATVVLALGFGALMGGVFSLRTKPKGLKALFALTTPAAAAFMVANALMSRRNEDPWRRQRIEVVKTA